MFVCRRGSRSIIGKSHARFCAYNIVDKKTGGLVTGRLGRQITVANPLDGVGQFVADKQGHCEFDDMVDDFFINRASESGIRRVIGK